MIVRVMLSFLAFASVVQAQEAAPLLSAQTRSFRVSAIVSDVI